MERHCGEIKESHANMGSSTTYSRTFGVRVLLYPYLPQVHLVTEEVWNGSPGWFKSRPLQPLEPNVWVVSKVVNRVLPAMESCHDHAVTHP
jgi:hypothetical protein